MARKEKSYLRKILRGTIISLNVIGVFIWSFYNTGVFIQNVDKGDQLQFACVATTIVAVGYLIASMIKGKDDSDLKKFWVILCFNFFSAPALITMLLMNGGIVDMTKCAILVLPFLLMGVLAPDLAFLVLEER